MFMFRDTREPKASKDRRGRLVTRFALLHVFVVINVIFGDDYMRWAQALDYICSHVCDKYTFCLPGYIYMLM